MRTEAAIAPIAAQMRAALYLRVSTGRQAEQDLSIPDQLRQAKAYCQAKGWVIDSEFVEPGATATDDKRPEFQRMMDAASAKPSPFNVILVHSFSRFFRDHFELEFYVRRLAKNGVRLVSITQDLGDDPMSVMMRQIMTLFDEYQSRENAKHTLRAMKENARQGFWNGSRPPFGYRIVDAGQRGSKTKKRLDIDPLQAETVRLMFRLALLGDGNSSPMGMKSVAAFLNAKGIRTRDGGRWGIAAVHKILTRTTYIGRHRFNNVEAKSGARKAETEVVETTVPSIVDTEEFQALQALLRSRSPQLQAPRVVSGPTLLTGICFCAACGGAMTLRTSGKGEQYRYYTCSTTARQGRTGCKGRTVPMNQLDEIVIDHLESRLLDPVRLEEMLIGLMERRERSTDRRRVHASELKKAAVEADAKVTRLYAAIENGVADLADPNLKTRLTELIAMRDAARTEVERLEAAPDERSLTSDDLLRFAEAARRRMRTGDGAFRRDHIRALAQRVEVGTHEVRIIGSTDSLVRTLTAAASVESAAAGVRSFVPKWRPLGDSNPCYRRERAKFKGFSTYAPTDPNRLKQSETPIFSTP